MSEEPEPMLGELLGVLSQGERGRSPLTAARQLELRNIYDSNTAQEIPPYEGVTFRNADEVMWVIIERKWSPLPDNLDEVINLSHATLKGIDLRPIIANNFVGGIAQINLEGTNLEQVNLSGVTLGLPKFDDFTWLSGANGKAVNLKDAILTLANLSGATIGNATLRGATLHFARLTGTNLFEVDLSGARLSGARMDPWTMLRDITLNQQTQFGDVIWNGAPLAQIAWQQIPILGDELAIQDTKGRRERITVFKDAARAYRGLSIALRAQGLLIPASSYRLREQNLERKAAFHERRLLSWSFSWLLNIVAGYGERPGRALVAYLLAIFGFAITYFIVGQAVGPHLSPLGAFVFSITSFHGRGFFPGGVALDDPLTVLAAFEAIIGLLIEITFIATFTQRFFAR